METRRFALDAHVLDSLMPDLVGHDRRPGAYLLYLALIGLGAETRAVGASLRTLAMASGLSKTAVQRSVAHLLRRGLIEREATGPTQAPRYRVLTPWRRT
jgi:DNA-binding MarR family transcriptional regulator